MHVWQSLISEALAERRWVIAGVHTHCRWCSDPGLPGEARIIKHMPEAMVGHTACR